MKNLIIICIIFNYVFDTKCNQECSQTICNPRAGDLLIGRESLLRASSTCGLSKIESYCVVTLTDRGRDPKCFLCYSKDAYNAFSSSSSHRIENLVSRHPQDPGRWWQSANGAHNTSIEITFESEFQFVYTQLRFKTYRPAAMYIERSKDYGRTWQKSAYFSDNCASDFPTVPERKRNTIDEVSCTSEFSSISPAEGGTVFFTAAPSDLHTKDKDWIEKRNEITAVTNMRVQFVRLHTFGDLKIDNNPNIIKKYYYALSEWLIRGRCSCYGHAARCKPKKGQMEQKEMVYGVCVCQHNTMGQHCEKCKDFFNDKPWLPAESNSTNECKKCECNKHSTSCHFDPVVFDLSGRKSGGICDNCLHNTEGQHCDRCRAGYFRNVLVHISSVETCIKCKCNPHGTNFPTLCIQEDDPEQNRVAGNCLCKANVGGYVCDQCKIGYWNFDKNNEQGCTECKCLMVGTIGNQGCDVVTGSCKCKAFVGGPLCNVCNEGYYNLSASNPSGCSPCGCDKRGTADNGFCDKSNGQCKCKQGYIGRTCNEVKNGWFIDSVKYPLIHRDTIQIELPPVPTSGYYNFIITVDTQQVRIMDTYIVIMNIDHTVKTSCPLYQDTVSITKDSKKIVVPNKCLVKDIPIIISLFLIEKPKDTSQTPSITDVVVIPMLHANSTATRSALSDCLKYKPASMPAKCNFMNVELSSRAVSNSDPKGCACNVTGSMNNVCNKVGGQCSCLPNVVGRQCDQCSSNSYGFDARGCKSCDCEPKGSLNLQCAADTGNCLCRAGVEGRHCNYCKPGFWKFPFCDPCKCHSMSEMCDHQTGECKNCKGNSFGFNCQQCNDGFYGDPTKNLPCLKCNCPGLSFNLNHSNKCSLIFNTSNYMCVCKSQYKGQYCDECQTNHYGNPRGKNGVCTPCHCSSNIDMMVPGSCDVRTGECKKCLYNTVGFNCEKCAAGYFGDGMSRTCKKCVCNQLGTNPKASETCQHETGKCPCLPNVFGHQCDKCQSGFYNISSSQGCLPCDCDSSNGALNETCNTLTGQCHCRESRSGRQCDKCEDGYWGDPRRSKGCKVCQCNFLGSLFNQCDRNNGACKCKPGITGRYCDSCARGTDGKMPDCTSCGDCWVQWDQSIQQILSSLDDLQNTNIENASMASVPEGLLVIIGNMDKYIEYLKRITSNIPDNMNSELNLMENKMNIIKEQIGKIGEINFDLSNYDSTNITRAIADMTEVVSSNKIQNSQEAYKVVLLSLRSVVLAVKSIEGPISSLNQMKKKVKDQEDRVNKIDLNDLETKSREMRTLESTLAGNLNHFNKLTCSSRSNNDSNLCSDPCGGIGCHPNNCFRTRPVTQQCYKDDKPNFFNAYAWKLEKRKIVDDYLKEMIENRPKDFEKTIVDTESLIDGTNGIIRLLNNTITSKFNWTTQLLNELRVIISNSVSEEEFKKLLSTISNFKLDPREEEIKGLEGEIQNRINELDNKVIKVLSKSEDNRKECDSLKKAALKAKEKASNLLKSIKDLEGNHRAIMKIQSEIKSMMLTMDFDIGQIENELMQIRQKQNQTTVNQDRVAGIMTALKYLEDNISNLLKVVVSDLHLLEKEQYDMERRLEGFKLRTTSAIQRRDSLNKDGNKMTNQTEMKRQATFLKVSTLNSRIQRFRVKVSEAKNSIEKKQSGLGGLSQRVEEQLQLISSLEQEIYQKSEFQTSCLP